MVPLPSSATVIRWLGGGSIGEAANSRCGIIEGAANKQLAEAACSKNRLRGIAVVDEFMVDTSSSWTVCGGLRC